MARHRALTILFASSLAVAAAALLFVACGPPAPIVVGGLVSETGPAARYGKMARQGMDLAIEEINAAGGLPNGRKLKIEYRDDGSSPAAAHAAVAELVGTMHVNAILGGITSAVAQGVIPQLLEREVVLISPSASNAELSSMGSGWFFRDYPSDTAEVEAMVRLARRVEVNDVAVLAQDETYGKGLADIFKHGFEQRGGRVRLLEHFAIPLPPPDAVALAKRVVDAKVGAVYLAGYETEIAAVLDALGSAGFKGLKLASSAVTPNVVRLAGANSERLVFPQSAANLETDDPKVKSFVAAFRKKYGTEPGIYAAYGYDAVRVFAAALGKTRMASAGEIREQLMQLAYDGVTGPIKFDNSGDIRRDPHLYAVVRGQMIHFEETDRDVRGVLLP